MPTPRLVQITAWSHSRFGTYNTCPAKAKFSIIDKIREPDSAAGLNGTRVHLIAAAWVTRRMPKLEPGTIQFKKELEAVLAGKKVPRELETFEEEFSVLRALKPEPHTEQEWAFDREWEPTSWFGSQAWLRIKVDLEYLETKKKGPIRNTTAKIRDYKTGKKNQEEHELQRSLYALGAFLTYPDIARVEVAHWYLDAGVEDVQEWDLSELDGLKEFWIKKIEAMMNDTTFAPRPGEYCRWCWFSKGKRANDSKQEQLIHPCQF